MVSTYLIGALGSALILAFVFPTFEKFGWWKVWIVWSLISAGVWALCRFVLIAPNSENHHGIGIWEVVCICDLAIYVFFILCSALYLIINKGKKNRSKQNRESKIKEQNKVDRATTYCYPPENKDPYLYYTPEDPSQRRW